MGDGSQPPNLALGLLLFVSAYLAFAETSLACVSRNKVRIAADRGDNRARYAVQALDNFDFAITTILICNNLVSISIATIVTLYVSDRWGLSYVTAGTLITTAVIFFACEMVPKSIAKKQSYWVLLYCAGPLLLLMKIFKPFAAFLTWIGKKFSDMSGTEDEVSVTENEIHDIIDDMTEDGALDVNQRSLISSALQFGDMTCESILTPRVDIAAINIDDDPEKIRNFVSNQSHSRIPVYKDTIDNIVGVLQIRKYMKCCIRNDRNPDISDLLDNVHFAHQSTLISDLMPVLSKQKISMAVITDSYGGTLGIITVEDILEELVGEIWDESDEIKEPIVKISECVFIADAEVSVSDLFEFVGYNDQNRKDENKNLLVGEWVYEQFTEIPKQGDSFTYGDMKVSVEKAEHNRIYKVRIDVVKSNSEGDV